MLFALLGDFVSMIHGIKVEILFHWVNSEFFFFRVVDVVVIVRCLGTSVMRVLSIVVSVALLR